MAEQRSAFVTERTECEKCLVVLRDVLLWGPERAADVRVETFTDSRMLAGVFIGAEPGSELTEAGKIILTIARRVCHPIRFAILPQSYGPVVMIAVPVAATVPAHVSVSGTFDRFEGGRPEYEFARRGWAVDKPASEGTLQ